MRYSEGLLLGLIFEKTNHWEVKQFAEGHKAHKWYRLDITSHCLLLFSAREQPSGLMTTLDAAYYPALTDFTVSSGCQLHRLGIFLRDLLSHQPCCWGSSIFPSQSAQWWRRSGQMGRTDCSSQGQKCLRVFFFSSLELIFHKAS